MIVTSLQRACDENVANGDSRLYEHNVVVPSTASRFRLCATDSL